MNKSGIHQTSISRQTITSWIHSILPDVPQNLKIQDLGKGAIYCRLINYYFPGTIITNRIISHPKSSYENTINLKMLQNTMAQLKINIHIDPIKLSKEKLSDNWVFVTALFKHLSQNHEESFNNSISKEEKGNHSNFPQNNASNSVPTVKRSMDQVYPENFYQGVPRQPFFNLENNLQQKNYFNSGKHSVGKLYKQNSTSQIPSSSPNKGKWSVNSLMFQNNLMPIIDRIKQILLKASHDTQKIRQVKMLLNIPLNEQVVVKVEEDENIQITMINQIKGDKTAESVSTIPTKTDIK